MSGESSLWKPYRLQPRGDSATSAEQVGPCGPCWAPSRRVTSSCRHIGALVACPLYSVSVANVVVRRRASSALRCAWYVRMRPAAITSEKAGLESVPYAQSADDAGSKGVTLANFGVLMGSMAWGTDECKAMEGTYASESSEPHPSDTILDRVAELSFAGTSCCRAIQTLQLLSRRREGCWLSRRRCMDGRERLWMTGSRCGQWTMPRRLRSLVGRRSDLRKPAISNLSCSIKRDRSRLRRRQ